MKTIVKLSVPKQASVKTKSIQKILVVSKEREPMLFEQDGQLARRKELMLAKEMM